MKKKFLWKILILIIIVVLVLCGTVFSMTGNTVVVNGQWCTDSDNGQKIEIGGQCSSSWAPSMQGSDECIGSFLLKEHYCWGGYLVKPMCISYTATCSRGCKSDACIR